MLKRKITEEELVEKIGDYSIFTHYFGKFRIGNHYKSAFDNDEHPSTGFFVNDKGRIVYNDFRNSKKWSSVTFVQQLFDISYHQAVKRIAIDFGILEGKAEGEKVAPIIKNTPKQKKEKKIEIYQAKWDEEYLSFWTQYHIDKLELKDNKILPVREFKINGYLIPYEENKPRYGLIFDDLEGNTYVKMYSPFEDKREYKWVNNGYNDIPFGINQLPYSSDTLIITKSQKDRIVLKKFFTDVIGFQSEGKGAYNYGKIEKVLDRYKNIIVWFDNDEPGINALKYLETEGFRTYHFPEFYLTNHNVKDPADFIKTWGEYNLELYLKQNNLL